MLRPLLMRLPIASPSVRSSKTCSRYIPQFRFPVSGLRENTIGSVTNGPPSSGQHVSTG